MSKRHVGLLGSMILCTLSLQALALPPVPPLPQSSKPRPPYILKSHHATHSPGGITPAMIRQAYGFPANYTGAGQTIAIVDSGDNPNIESDLNTFSTQFNLPACTTANGCFKKVFSNGTPPGDASWGIETSLDVEWAHAIAPAAKIILVESYDAYGLMDAVQYAETLKPSVISLSWVMSEFSGETYYDAMLQASTAPIFAASGDYGTGVAYPASSPYVVGVGGTQISMDSSGNYISETAWSGSGGGLSTVETEPAFQKNYVIPQANGMRGTPDVAYNGSPGASYAVYDTYGEGGWMQIAGTSASTPQWAALVADIKAAKNGNFGSFNTSLYGVARQTNPVLLHSVTTGSNGSCGYFCTARSGYDYITGLGTPMASNLINRFK